ncbi:hypothetical protein BSPWISOXPB_5933 [uncultured Gammaproteobacteria bacterium]|nr:hypothetical protein BSPWISOXPB_5933 [uncultured Gammaproteobacteria bacterium]
MKNVSKNIKIQMIGVFMPNPNACSNCGPQLQLTNSKGQDIATDKIIAKTATLLKQGKI